MACLRPRHALSYRVLVSTGGFQRGTLEAVNPDSSMCVALVGGGRRWCSAAEVAFVPIGGARPRQHGPWPEQRPSRKPS